MTNRVPALTLQQPWGWAIVQAGKDVENRTWGSKHRGVLLIHQGKGRDRSGEQFPPLTVALTRAAERLDPNPHAAGVILGWVNVTGCHEQRPGCCASRWANPGLWHWELSGPRALTRPVPAKGALGLWWPDEPTIKAIRAAA